MELNNKRQFYRVEIRKRNQNQKLNTMRAELLGQDVETDPERAVENIRKMMKDLDQNNFVEYVDKMKNYSQNQAIIGQLKQHFGKFLQLLLKIDQLNLNQNSGSEKQKKNIFQQPSTISSIRQTLYTNICTILINILSFDQIEIESEMSPDYFNNLWISLQMKQRQTNVVWLLGSILMGVNNFAGSVFKGLFQNNLISYISNRMDRPFPSSTAITVFYYFLGGVVSNLQLVQSFQDYKSILTKIDRIYETTKNQQLFEYMLNGLGEHAGWIGQFNYEVFQMKIMSKCGQFVRAKKSRIINKYLNIMRNFIGGELNYYKETKEISSSKNSVHLTNKPKKNLKQKQNLSKILDQQYQRLKKYKLISELQMCLSNRSPTIKSLLLEIATLLVTGYSSQINFVDEYFYLTLAEQVKKIDKSSPDNQAKILKYIRCLMIQIYKMGVQYHEHIEEFLKESQLVDRLAAVVKGEGDALKEGLETLLVLLEREEEGIVGKLLRDQQLLFALENVKSHNEEILKTADTILSIIKIKDKDGDKPL